jgi:hypothetical protein
LIAVLPDELSRECVEIDRIKFSGPAFPGIDNRLVSLQLVERALTHAATFTAGGEVVQPSQVLHKKPILVERERFRPATRVTLDPGSRWYRPPWRRSSRPRTASAGGRGGQRQRQDEDGRAPGVTVLCPRRTPSWPAGNCGNIDVTIRLV